MAKGQRLQLGMETFSYHLAYVKRLNAALTVMPQSSLPPDPAGGSERSEACRGQADRAPY